MLITGLTINSTVYSNRPSVRRTHYHSCTCIYRFTWYISTQNQLLLSKKEELNFIGLFDFRSYSPRPSAKAYFKSIHPHYKLILLFNELLFYIMAFAACHGNLIMNEVDRLHLITNLCALVYPNSNFGFNLWFLSF